MQNISDSEYIGWTEQVISEWEEGIFLLPMWHQSMYMPKDLWILYQTLHVLHTNPVNLTVH